MDKNDTLFKDREPQKTIPYPMAHTYKAHIGEYPSRELFTAQLSTWCHWNLSTLEMEPIYGSVFVKPLSQTALTFLMPSAILEEAPYKELVPSFSLDHGQET